MTTYLRRSYSLPPLPDPSALPFPGNLIRLCTSCGLRAGCRAPVPGAGPTPADVMLVGEAPGAEEDSWGLQPFVGKAGQQLNALLSQIGLSRDLVYLSNTVHCRPPGNREPRSDEIAACSRWLKLELDLVNPHIIVALGAPAIRWFLGEAAGIVEHLHGKPVVKDGRIILPSYHPAAPMHGDTALLRHLYDDFRVLHGLVSGEDPSSFCARDEYPNPEYQVASDPSIIAGTWAKAKLSGEVAVDTETCRGKLWSVQLSAEPGTATFVPVDPKSGDGRIDLSGFAGTVIVHHYLHDVLHLKINDDRFVDTMTQAYLCGQSQGLKELASRLSGLRMVNYVEVVRPAQRKLSLDYLSRVSSEKWPDPPGIEETRWDNKAGRVITRIKKPWHISRKVARILADTVDKLSTDPCKRWTDIPSPEREIVESKLGPMPEASLMDILFEEAALYANRDADATIRVYHKLSKMISDLDLDFVLRMDVGVLPMADEMMANGMAVDLAHLRSLSEDYDVRMRVKALELASQVGHSFNPNSSQQVAVVVYQELGFKPTKFTPTREISTDDQELKKTGHPVAKGIIEYRRLSKMKGTYADALVEWARPDEQGVPRVHTTLKTTRVETGRWASADPNLQNVPTRSKEGKAIKNAFVAPPDKLLAEGDLAQIEMCTQAHLAECRGLIEMFLRGGDPHTETAARIFGVPLEEAKKDKYRYPCKRAGFGIIYLMGAEGLSSQINEYIADLEMEGEKVDIESWDVPTCERFIADYYHLYPEIRDYQMEMAAMARRLGYTRDMFGRIRYIPEVSCPIRAIQEAGLRQAANFPVTASAQGLLKTAMGRLWRDLPGTGWRGDVRWLLQIHDSLLIEVTDDEKVWRPFLSWMRNVMCGVVQLRVPVKVDFKKGTRWGEMEKVKL